MSPEEIRSKIRALDCVDWNVDEEIWPEMKALGASVVPYLREAYPSFRKWQGRAALVHHAIRFARVCEDAYQLGLMAVGDRSTAVRYKACMLLAYAQKDDATERLQTLLTHKDRRTVADAMAAIDAIRSRNHHYFKDRDHSGRVFLVVNPSDRPTS